MEKMNKAKAMLAKLRQPFLTVYTEFSRATGEERVEA